MAYILVTASDNDARERLYEMFDRYNDNLTVSKIDSRAYLVESDGRALEKAYREKLRNNFGIDIYFVEEIHDRDIPDEVKKNAEWNINNPNLPQQQKNKAIERNELLPEETLEQCKPKMKCTRTSDERESDF